MVFPLCTHDLTDSLDMSDDSANLSSTEATQVKSLKGPWLCPWGTTVVDEVAPAFKSILAESHSSSSTTEEDTIESRGLWWKKRKKLNHRLGIFLRYAGSLSITRAHVCLYYIYRTVF